MRLQFKSHIGEPSVKMYALFFPLLLLVIIPLALAFALPLLFPSFQNYNMFSPEFFRQFGNMSSAEVILLMIPFVIVSLPVILFFIFYIFFGYGVFSVIGDKKFFASKYSRIQINLYEVLSRIAFAEIIVLVALTILYYSFIEQTRDSTFPLPLIEIGAYIKTMLIASVLLLSLLHLWSHFGRDFRYIMTKKCMGLANEKVDEVDSINYLIAGLSWYSKYLESNFDLEFDDKRVSSNIICSSSKNQIMKTIQESFGDNSDDKPNQASTQEAESIDKLKPASCLSTFANLEPKEQFLIDKKISTKIKEVGIFLAAIIPVVIAVLQFAIPQFLPKPSG